MWQSKTDGSGSKVNRMLCMRLFRSMSLICALVVVCLSAVAQRQVRLPAPERRALETFFSNFAEAGVGAFREGHLAERDLIAFGVRHNYRNNFKRFENIKGTGKVRIAARHVEESVRKFFGRGIANHRSLDRWTVFRDGYYVMDAADGDAWDFSQVSEFRSLGHDWFSAVVAVFTAPNTWGGDVHAPQSTWRDDGPGVPQFHKHFIGTIKRVTEHNQRRYILLDYRDWSD